jgi:hypothetical protein
MIWLIALRMTAESSQTSTRMGRFSGWIARAEGIGAFRYIGPDGAPLNVLGHFPWADSDGETGAT